MNLLVYLAHSFNYIPSLVVCTILRLVWQNFDVAVSKKNYVFTF